MYNRTGRSTLPYGTPAFISLKLNMKLFCIILKSLSDMKYLIVLFYQGSGLHLERPLSKYCFLPTIVQLRFYYVYLFNPEGVI